MTAFEKLQKFLADLEAQKWELTDRKNVLLMQRATKVQELDEALLSGDGAEIQTALDVIDGEIAPIDQRIEVINATLARRRQSPTLAGLVQATIAESREGITGKYRTQWDEAAKELARIDEARLVIVANLGEISRAAQRLTNQAAQAADYLPSPKPAVPSLETGIIIRHDRKSGIIFPALQQIEKTFKGAI